MTVRPGRWWAGAVALAVLAVTAAGCGGEGGAAGGSPEQRSITVAAASDLQLAFAEVAEQFSEASGIEVTFSFGSSGQLREQILHGAPFDLFASANVDYVDEVVTAGEGDPATRADYAFGRLALVAAPGRVVPASVEALADARYRRVAIANPDHAPYGVAAMQALGAAGVLDAVRPKLVLGESISDTLRIVGSGNAAAGIVALSLVVAGERDYVLIDDALHEPIRQALVVTGEGQRGEDARRFAAFLTGPQGRQTMARYGFVLPGDDRRE